MADMVCILHIVPGMPPRFDPLSAILTRASRRRRYGCCREQPFSEGHISRNQAVDYLRLIEVKKKAPCSWQPTRDIVASKPPTAVCPTRPSWNGISGHASHSGNYSFVKRHNGSCEKLAIAESPTLSHCRRPRSGAVGRKWILERRCHYFSFAGTGPIASSLHPSSAGTSVTPGWSGRARVAPPHLLTTVRQRARGISSAIR